VEVLAAAEEEDQRMIAEFDAIASAKPDATALAYLSSSSLSSSSSSSSSMGSVPRRHSLPIGGAVSGAGDGSGDGSGVGGAAVGGGEAGTGVASGDSGATTGTRHRQRRSAPPGGALLNDQFLD
jgi:hypothetical protein